MSKIKDNELAVQLNNALGQLKRRLRKETGKQPFSLTEQATMALLDANKKMLPSELAEAHHISAQGISQIINRLYDQNCIEKSEDKADKRKVYISLNKCGRQKLLEIRAARSEWLALAIGKELSVEDREALPKLIHLLARLSSVELK